jgi:L-ascorbate metabolism protein UlaG (beta-lactamase superfamily)
MEGEYWKYTVAPDTVLITEAAFEKRDDTRVYWLAAAGFMVNARGPIICVDPVLSTKLGQKRVSESGNRLRVDLPINADAVPKADIVLYTHIDEDHMGRDTAKTMSKLAPLFIGPPPVAMTLAKLRADPDRIEMCRTGDHYEIGDITIDVIVADHPWQLLDPAKFGKIFRSYDCNGFVLTTPDMSMYFPGDTRILEEHMNIPKVDVFALDSSMSIFHLSYEGAMIMANILEEALLIPCHYGTIDSPNEPSHCGCPEDLIKMIRNGDKRVRKIAPGECLVMKNHKEVCE